MGSHYDSISMLRESRECRVYCVKKVHRLLKVQKQKSTFKNSKRTKNTNASIMKDRKVGATGAKRDYKGEQGPIALKT